MLWLVFIVLNNCLICFFLYWILLINCIFLIFFVIVVVLVGFFVFIMNMFLSGLFCLNNLNVFLLLFKFLIKCFNFFFLEEYLIEFIFVILFIFFFNFFWFVFFVVGLMCIWIFIFCFIFVVKWFIFIIVVKKIFISNNVIVIVLIEVNVIYLLCDRFFIFFCKCWLRVLVFIFVFFFNFILNNFFVFNCDYMMMDCIYDICIMCRYNNCCVVFINVSKNIYNIKSCFNI